MLIATKLKIVLEFLGNKPFTYETYYKSNSTPHAIADGVKHACYKAKETYTNIGYLEIAQVIINEVGPDGKLDLHQYSPCFKWHSDMENSLMREAKLHVGKLLNDFCC